MQQVINNQDTGLVVREALNNMFTELYGNVRVPVKLVGISANATYQVAANTFVASIEATSTTGTPTLRIGLTPNGTEIMEDVLIGSFNTAKVDLYFPDVELIYLSVTGEGILNIRIDLINNYF